MMRTFILFITAVFLISPAGGCTHVAREDASRISLPERNYPAGVIASSGGYRFRIPLESTHSRRSFAFTGYSQSQATAAVPEETSTVPDGTVLHVDTTWRGTVLVRGSVIVAPQATLRIEPGTIVRFSSEDAKNMPSRLVVQGRIQAVGTADKRIMMTSERPDGWGGVLLHATEKRNQLEQCSIEHASVAVGMQYSVLALKNCSLTHARVGILSRDSFVQLSGGSISGGGIGIELHDSELEARDTAISSCRQGVVAFRSSVALTSVRISGSEQFGFTADECRIRLTSSELSSNGTGARIKGGSGQISMGSFVKNRVVALHLSGARLKINRCSFSETGGDAVRFEDGQALVWDSAFSANAGYNIYNAGSDDVHAIQNWWGSSDRSGIVGKIFDRARNTGSGVVHYSPWATAKPALAP